MGDDAFPAREAEKDGAGEGAAAGADFRPGEAGDELEDGKGDDGRAADADGLSGGEAGAAGAIWLPEGGEGIGVDGAAVIVEATPGGGVFGGGREAGPGEAADAVEVSIRAPHARGDVPRASPTSGPS